MKAILLLLLVPFVCAAQSKITPEDRNKASALYASGDWVNSAIAYRRISDAEPQNWNALTRLGVSLTNSGKANEAIKPLEEAVKIGNNNQSMFYLASAYAATNQKDLAFQWLGQSIKNGFALLTVFENDKYMNALSSDERYVVSRDAILRSVYPCRYDAHAREFDFWIGEWDVKNLQGQTSGKSKIENILGDCVIFENWISALPNMYEGKSFNLYNPTTKKWMQTWVDDKGAVTEFINGEYKEGKMVFVTLPDAQKTITRLTFYNLGPNQVRQHFETTSDDGKTWTTTVDLMYNRVH